MVDNKTTRLGKAPSLTAQSDTTPNHSGSAAGLDADIQAHIGRQLRAVYDDIASEPIPDRFLQLLRELDRKRDAT